ncbi:serine/threonine protein phosphatase [Seohaeicola saemankumensis]|uniref:metallophosphoesterase family protein n=1 Tax=Seohaeicola saemankumensis TaxID=481181 RepID=UPI001E368ECF|nr:metallophosphoesterase family protein [Seohaeicola saemankumensis]MCD1626751.1 serine/threonine protein phosphatase [Seohaeicola saemankumensis]
MNQPLYVIGDIHGQMAMLDVALDRIAADGGADAPMISLGDLVDRGPDSRAVIDTLLTGQAEGLDWTVLKGNHDRMFQNFIEDARLHDARVLSGVDWLNPRLGGVATLASYGIDGAEKYIPEDLATATRQAVPATHLEFLQAMPLYHQVGNLLFVHAGITPGVPLDRQTEDDLLWIRAPFLDHTEPHPWLVVHGHTALQAPAHYGNRINLDSGAGYDRPLTVAVFEQDKVWTLGPDGRKPLLP